MNRTQGDDDWVVVRPFLQVPSNCIAPRAYVERIREVDPAAVNYEATYALCGQSKSFGTFDPATDVLGYLAQAYGFTYDPFAPYNPDTVGALVPSDPANPDAWPSQVSGPPTGRSEEHTSELQSLMRISYAVFCLNKKNKQTQ